MPSAAENLHANKEPTYYEQMMVYIQRYLPDRYTDTSIYPNFNVEKLKNAGNQKGHDAEKLVYDVLSGIEKQPMVTLFSYEFPAARNGEIDFLLLHMRKGIIILEVKAWDSFVANRKATAKSDMEKKVDGIYINLQKSKQLRKKLLHRPRFGFVMTNISEQNMDGYCFKENLQDSQSFLKWFDTTFNDLEHQREELLNLYDSTLCVLFPFAVNKRSYDGITEKLILLTPEQVAAVDGCPCEQVIAGPAGSGKTEVLINKVMSEELKEQRKLVICFTRALKEHLSRNRLEKCENLDIYTFDKLTLDIVGGDLEDSKDMNTRLAKAVYKIHQKGHYWRGRYDSIFIDEAQDLSAWNWGKVVNLLHNKGPNHYLWVFYDPNQNTFAGRDHFDVTKTYTLKYVIRNTINVFEVSRHFYRSAKPMIAKHRHEGPVVDWIPVQTQDFEKFGPETMQVLKNKIIEVGKSLRKIPVPGEITSFAPGDVTILLDEYRREKMFLESFNASIAKSSSGSQSGNAMLLTTYDALDMVRAPLNSGWRSKGKHGVTVSTVRKFKGLESKVVILLLKSDPEIDIELMYVGITRCFCKLIIIHPDCYQMPGQMKDETFDQAQAISMEVD